MLLRKENIGGGVVRRGFVRGSEWLKPGTPLTRAEILAFPSANLQALHDGGQLDIYPPGTAALEQPATPVEPLPRFVISAGFGNYHVVEGTKLTTGKGLPKAAALALAEAGGAPQGDPPVDEPEVEEPPPAQ